MRVCESWGEGQLDTGRAQRLQGLLADVDKLQSVVENEIARATAKQVRGQYCIAHVTVVV